jgi:hypothetical protein
VAPIHSDGTLGNWSATTNLPAGRYGHASVALDGYLYVIAGFGDTALLGDVMYAPIHSNGTVGAWNSSASLSPARSEHSAALSNGTIFVTGGFDNNGSYFNDAQSAQINGPAPWAAYSKLLDLGSDQVLQSLQFDSTSGRKGAVNVTYAVAPSGTKVFGARATLTDAPPGVPCATVPGCGRWVWVRFDLDDGNSATIDSGGTLGRMDLLDFILNYGAQSDIGDTLDATKTNKVHLTWDAVAGATSYRVNRCDATGGHCTPSLIATTSNLFYDDSALGDARRYWYTVQAVNGACVSP